MRSRRAVALAGQHIGDASGLSGEIFTVPRVRRTTDELSMRIYEGPSSSEGTEHASAREHLEELDQTDVRFPY